MTREFLIAVIARSIAELIAAATTKAIKTSAIQRYRKFLMVDVNRWIAELIAAATTKAIKTSVIQHLDSSRRSRPSSTQVAAQQMSLINSRSNHQSY